jgi:uncharacterized membrane protein
MRTPALTAIRSSRWSALASATALALLLACQEPNAPDPSRLPAEPSSGAPAALKSVPFATLVALPTLSGHTSEALAVNSAGTVVAGYAWEAGTSGTIRAVRWTQKADGSWAIAVLPTAAGTTGAIARGVDNQGNAAGNDFLSSTSRAVLWPRTGGFTLLSCAGETGAATVYGLSADGQAAVGNRRTQPARGAVWRPGGCRQDLPLLAAGAGAVANAVNGNGTIVGGGAALTSSGDQFPVRWTSAAGQWQVQRLDQRPGAVYGANGTGDLAGLVRVSCSTAGGCQRAMIWYANGSTRQLGTLGGSDSWARDINAAGEVVGASTSSQGNTGYFWSAATGMRLLPSTRCCTAANAVSDIRADGTRLVAGIALGNARAVVWVVR